MPQLIVSVQGVDIKHVWLTKDRTTLGRGPENDIVLSNSAVSTRHCAFLLRGLADVVLEDLRSTNGTFVNHQRVAQPTRLHDGDEIAISGFRIRYLSASDDTGFGSTAVLQMGPDGQVPPQRQASFRVLNGSSKGLEMPVVKAVTTYGRPGACVISVSHRRTGFFVAHLDGREVPLLNGRGLGADPTLLRPNDKLSIAGTELQFLLTD
ncbi:MULTISPECIES: FHA domain-containing protein [Ramlibacter]|uniref:FHA domain-containing protein n=1 Tax=Ramlibacter aquaticus TaxID=2780094 RepID=A0ABR9SDT9_9BURK|nr:MULTISPECIES: FHA domain-containing protein [Ramlibacter]MBE7940515.1 FHA domain-containing protein [Ramlibacter aquaticus]